jgi:hypothetical protein
LSVIGAAGGMKSGPTAQAASGKTSAADRVQRAAPRWKLLIPGTSLELRMSAFSIYQF